MVSEFPKWEKARKILACNAGLPPGDLTETLSYYRRKYNAGRLVLANPGRKGPISFKYNSEGERITNFNCRGAKPKLLPQAEYDRILNTYGPDNRNQQDFDFTVRDIPQPDRVKKAMGPKTYASFDWCI